MEAIERALGRRGQAPRPLDIGLETMERSELLRDALCFPDRALPTGELAHWAVVLLELDKEITTAPAVAAVEAARDVMPPGGDTDFVSEVLAERHAWLESPKSISDLRRPGDLWPRQASVGVRQGSPV